MSSTAAFSPWVQQLRDEPDCKEWDAERMALSAIPGNQDPPPVNGLIFPQVTGRSCRNGLRPLFQPYRLYGLLRPARLFLRPPG